MAVDMFLKFDNIKGESQEEGHKDWIEIESFSWGLSQTGSFGTGGGGGAGKASLHDLSFTHRLDKASPQLMLACCTGKHIPSAVLAVSKATEGKKQDYLIY